MRTKVCLSGSRIVDGRFFNLKSFNLFTDLGGLKKILKTVLDTEKRRN